MTLNLDNRSVDDYDLSEDMQITLDTKISRSTAQMCCDLGAQAPEVVVLNTANNHYFGLEDVAGRIWQLLEKPTTAGEIVAVITDEFDVAPAACREDTIAFLQRLAENGLISAAES